MRDRGERSNRSGGDPQAVCGRRFGEGDPGAGRPSVLQHRGQRDPEMARSLSIAWSAPVRWAARVISGAVLAASVCQAEPDFGRRITSEQTTRLAAAIWKAEGKHKARVPYGILSVPVKNKTDARLKCEATIRRTFDRWNDAGRPGSFIKFLALRYVPPSKDPKGHDAWVINVTKHYQQRRK